MGAQYFTAVSSQRALRHVGISEADYAMQFIHLKENRPFRSKHTEPVHVTGQEIKYPTTGDASLQSVMHYGTGFYMKCVGRDATKKNVHIRR